MGLDFTKFDAPNMADWEIAALAEEVNMKPITEIADELGLVGEELIPMGKYVAKIDYMKVLDRLKDKKDGKYVNVTAITPTPLGEGKTTTSMGLVQGLGLLGKNVVGAIRQPSGGPTFNVKGSAAGGGISQTIPLTPFSLGLTGDIDNIMNAHNLMMVALTSRMQHEQNNNDAFLEKKGLKRLDIDPNQVQVKWIIDFCAQALRNITIGHGERLDGMLMESGFAIAVSSEIMAILAVAKDLADMRERMGKIIVAYSKEGKAVTTEDLDVAGAMTAWMVKALNPNLLQTVEGQPVIVHAGPFANIAIGQSSIIADRIGLKLSDYLVTESGFGADIGFEKFWNLKCRFSGLIPNCSVIVATVRALKMHGGGPAVVPGRPLAKEYVEENVDLVVAGCCNLIAHIETVKKAGIAPVVCINSFYTDTEVEIAAIKAECEKVGARCAVSRHWQFGGEGAKELCEAVISACEEPTDNFKFLYEDSTPLKKRIELLATEVYGADGASFTDEALKKIEMIDNDPELSKLGTCMVKTHLSLSHDPTLKGRPKGFIFPIRDVLIYQGAGFCVPLSGTIKLMPGTASDPAYRRIDVDTKTGQVKGLF